MHEADIGESCLEKCHLMVAGSATCLMRSIVSGRSSSVLTSVKQISAESVQTGHTRRPHPYSHTAWQLPPSSPGAQGCMVSLYTGPHESCHLCPVMLTRGEEECRERSAPGAGAQGKLSETSTGGGGLCACVCSGRVCIVCIHVCVGIYMCVHVCVCV